MYIYGWRNFYKGKILKFLCEHSENKYCEENISQYDEKFNINVKTYFVEQPIKSSETRSSDSWRNENYPSKFCGGTYETQINCKCVVKKIQNNGENNHCPGMTSYVDMLLKMHDICNTEKFLKTPKDLFICMVNII